MIKQPKVNSGGITPAMLATKPYILEAVEMPPYDPERQYAVGNGQARMLMTTWWYSTQTFDGSGKPSDGDQVDSNA